ncbi:calcium-binding protein [Microvirga terricola]|uniref:Calcium-binding protein n=1 Tax=Microvirga terricola TaxID=2719797 RepID=A0ABX0VDW0_9HYPH|nr:calcium-binding protein [Microvirga terricola]NIX77848.1 calcium-binding protein [Microvirga terricola]
MTIALDSTLTTLANGSYLSVWTSSSNAVAGQIASARTTSKGVAFSIATDSDATRSHLSATELSDGRFVVVWEETSASGKHTIQARLFGANGTPSSDIFEIGASAANRASPSVIADHAGGFSVVGNDGTKVTRINVDAAGEQSASKVLMNTGFNPSVAILSDGNVITVAATPSQTPPGYEITGVIQQPDGEVLMSVFIFRNEPVPAHPSVSALSGGKFLISWVGEQGGKNLALLQAVNSDGTKLGMASYFEPPAGQQFSTPIVQGLPDGGYVFAMALEGGGHSIVYAGSSKSPLHDPAADLVDKGSTADQLDPSIAMLRDGRHVVTWLEASGSSYVAKSKVFDSREDAVNVTGTQGNDEYVGTTYNDTLTGAGGNDYLEGKGGNDKIDGGAGADTMVGGHDWWSSNSTTYYVDNALDRCIETSDGGIDKVVTSINHTLGSYLENLTATGSDALVLTGNSLANTIAGNSGNNRINGGLGKDTLKGGAGKDVFAFDTKLGKTNIDTIADFSVRDDSIYLDNKYMPKLGKSGSLSKPAKLNAKMFWTGAAAHDADDRIIYNKKTGALFYDADGSGKGAAIQIATLSKGLKLKADDFFVI